MIYRKNASQNAPGGGFARASGRLLNDLWERDSCQPSRLTLFRGAVLGWPPHIHTSGPETSPGNDFLYLSGQSSSPLNHASKNEHILWKFGDFLIQNIGGWSGLVLIHFCSKHFGGQNRIGATILNQTYPWSKHDSSLCIWPLLSAIWQSCRLDFSLTSVRAWCQCC